VAGAALERYRGRVTAKEEIVNHSLASKVMLLVLVSALLSFPMMSFAADTGAELFAAKCQACHGKAGDAESPMAKKFAVKPLSAPEVQKNSDADLTNIITKGKDKMPSYDGKLTPDQIKSLVSYIRSLKK
jgi:cytochrome c6